MRSEAWTKVGKTLSQTQARHGLHACNLMQVGEVGGSRYRMDSLWPDLRLRPATEGKNRNFKFKS